MVHSDRTNRSYLNPLSDSWISPVKINCIQTILYIPYLVCRITSYDKWSNTPVITCHMIHINCRGVCSLFFSLGSSCSPHLEQTYNRFIDKHRVRCLLFARLFQQEDIRTGIFVGKDRYRPPNRWWSNPLRPESSFRLPES